MYVQTKMKLNTNKIINIKWFSQSHYNPYWVKHQVGTLIKQVLEATVYEEQEEKVNKPGGSVPTGTSLNSKLKLFSEDFSLKVNNWEVCNNKGHI